MPKTQRSRWALPNDVNPSGTRCFFVTVPDDVQYIAAFKGAVFDLTKPYAWGNDEEHTAILAGQKMEETWATLTEVSCEGTMLLRACETDCGIEYSTDGGVTWTCINLNGCITDLITQGIEGFLDNGTIAPGGQPGPTAPPPLGECKTFDFKIDGNDYWHSPFPVSAGNTIRVFNLSGGWTDGTPEWYCPDGRRYLLGVCGTEGQRHDETDPTQDAYHMSVVGNFGSTWFATADTYIVPQGTAATDFVLQANDGSLNDNGGSITGKVEICTNTLEYDWVFTFDFTETPANNKGFTGLLSAQAPIAGEGWADEQNGGYRTVRFYRPTDGNVNVVHIDVGINYQWGNYGYDDGFRINDYYDQAHPLLVKDTRNLQGEFVWSWDGDEQVDSVMIDASQAMNNSQAGSIRVRYIAIYGRGAPPPNW